MIKHITLVRWHATLDRSELEARWIAALAAPGSGPLRRVACVALPHIDDTPDDTPHDAISVHWFADAAALAGWEGLPLSAAALVDATATRRIVVEEHVLRGADWLAERWREGRSKLKHMALARRAAGLSAAEFSERWRHRPGRIGGASAPVVEIPTLARGQAYLQNHPVSGDGSYDAINEVYFDDLAGLQARIAFFREHDVLRMDADLVSEARFMVVREHVLPA